MSIKNNPSIHNVELPPELDKELSNTVNRTGLQPVDIINQALRMYFSEKKDKRRNSIYLSAPVNALVEGIYEENTLIADVKQKGDFGIGTFNNLDGEMVILDGIVYQLKADGCCYIVEDTVQTPFACVTFFSPDTVDDIEGDFDYDAFNELLDRSIPSPNMLYAIRIDGRFTHVKTRSVPKQENYRPLVEVARDQPIFDYNDIDGTLVGFYNPPFIASVNVPGYHLHFLSEDRRLGGHLLECRMQKGRIGLQHVPTMELDLPVTFDYLTTDLTRDTGKDLEEVER